MQESLDRCFPAPVRSHSFGTFHSGRSEPRGTRRDIRVKVGLFGAGRIGTLHAGNLSAHPSVTELLVFDPLQDRAAALADRFEATIVDSAASLMQQCDAAVIATSTDSHADDLVLAAEAGKPAFCEKPISATLADTDRAIAAVERSGIPVQMGFNRRFDRGFRAAQAAVADGSVGTLLLVVGHHHDHRPPPEEYIPVSGGQFKDQLIHDFDLVRFVTGDEVTRVFAAGTSHGLEVFGKYDDTAVTTVTLTLRSGAMAMVCGVRTDPIGYDVRMEIFGTGDSIAVGVDDQTPLRSVERGESPPNDPYREWLQRFGDSFSREIDAFVSMAEGQSESACTVYDARAALVIAEACRQSLDRGAPIDISEAA